jgi:hypothetical protein
MAPSTCFRLGPSVWPELRPTVLHLRRLQPDAMLAASGIGNYYKPEGVVPGTKGEHRRLVGPLGDVAPRIN